MTKVNGDAAHQQGERQSRPHQFGMRRSCDACGLKKKRCDGGQPCSRCLQSESQCNYSRRRWHCGVQANHLHQRQLRHSDQAVNAMEDLIHATPAALMERRMLPLKRCRFKTSPATGLVGLKENTFLSDFFGCIGFLPFTDERQIRETMVKIMLLPEPRQGSSSGAACGGEDGQFGAPAVGGTFTRIQQLPKDPSFCTFWCAVALGALAKGSPIESVATYAQLAKEALAASRSVSTHDQLAKASVILTYLHSFTGDMARFHEYLELSESFLRVCNEQWSTATDSGLPDLVLHCRWVSNINNGSIASSLTQDYDPPQLDGVTSERELYKYVARSFRAFDSAILVKAQEQCPSALETLDDAGWLHLKLQEDSNKPGQESEAIAAVLRAGHSPDFEALQEIADRPSIRAGIGGLLINGTLAFDKAVTGDVDATLERLDRSVEVFERYPGLTRCMMESHVSHMLLTSFAELDDCRARGMYERLRGASNSCRAPHSLPIPPLDEWQGMAAICSEPNCRTIEALIKSEHMKAFTTTPAESVQGGAGLAQNFRTRQGQTESEALRTSFPYKEFEDLFPASPTRSMAKSDVAIECPKNQNPAGAVCHAEAILEPIPYPVYLRSPLEKDLDLDCGATKVTARVPHALSKPPEVGERDANIPQAAEDNEIAEADWAEVARVMLDAVHACEIK